MRELLHQYFNIAFLMGKPQDLPVGSDQMKIGVMLTLITYITALAVPYGLSQAVLRASIDLGFTALVFYIALGAMGYTNRFHQAFGGWCGASSFINLAAIPLYALRSPGSAGSESATMLPDFLLLVWGLSLLGHVIRYTFEVRMMVSIVISFAYFVLLITLISVLLPPPIVASSSISSLNWDVLFAVSDCEHSWV